MPMGNKDVSSDLSKDREVTRRSSASCPLGERLHPLWAQRGQWFLEKTGTVPGETSVAQEINAGCPSTVYLGGDEDN